MAYPGPHGTPPYGGPQPNYPITPQELRYPYEIPTMIATFAGVGIILFLIGLMQAFIAIAVTVVLLAIFLYFGAISRVGDSVQVNPQQLPELYAMTQVAASRLAMEAPDLYISQMPFLQAEAQDIGKRNGQIMLTTALVEAMTPAELQFLIARQCGHVKCRHSSLAMLHGNTAGGALGAIGSLIAPLLQAIFTWWHRTVELTGDRAGLIGGQDIRAAITAILKEMVGPQVFDRLNIPALLQQMEELQGSQLAQVAQTIGLSSTPYALNRIRELLRFYKSPLYQNVAARQGKAGTTMLQYGGGVATGHLFEALAHQAQAERDRANQAAAPAAQPAPAPAPAPAATICQKCGSPLRKGARFCAACGSQQG